MIKNTTNRIVGIDRSSTAVSKGKICYLGRNDAEFTRLNSRDQER